jgi:hypothetical protein
MAADSIVNAYLDANILLVSAYALWSFVLAVLSKTGLRRAYSWHLKLLNIVVFAVAISPVVVYLLGGWTSAHSLSISDVVVAQYLDGHVEINPVRLEELLGLREGFVQDIIHHQTPLSRALLGGLAAGFVFFTLKGIRNALLLKNLLGRCYPWRRFGNIRLLLSDTALIPFSTRALKNRYIVIPSVMLEHSSDVKLAVGHELQHIRQRDVDWAILLEVLTPFFFWNPVFFLWKRKVTRLREYACDQKLVTRPNYDVRSYCECLLRVCDRNLRGKENFALVSFVVPLLAVGRTGFGRETSLLRDRIVALTSPVNRAPTGRISLLIAALLMVVIAMTALFIQRPSDWSHDRLMLSTIVNLERMDQRKSVTGFGVRPLN